MKKKKRFIQKKSFVLFELLVALGLVTVCFLPLITPQIRIYRMEKAQLVKTQLEIAASQALCCVKSKLFEHYHPWDKLMGRVEGTLNPIKLFNREYLFRYRCQRIDRFPKRGEVQLAVIEVALELQPPLKGGPFLYTICIERV